MPGLLLCAHGAGAAVAQSPAAATAPAEPSGTLRSDADAPYVHRLTLYDHDGRAIDPADPNAPPYSPRATCGKCHDYSAISHGWHFSAGRAEISAGRLGEPWLLTDAASGTQLPISGRRWPGVFSPADAGLSPFLFLGEFGRHLPGGGFVEPTAREQLAARESARWAISGPLEIDCMTCHAADASFDAAEAARQVAEQNHRWVPTATLGLGVIRGQARKLPDDFDPLLGPSPDHPERVLPKVVYDRARFDADDRVFFDIVRSPPNARCLFCHSESHPDLRSEDRLRAQPDVHLAAGMRCTDCHRNGIDHAITRGVPEDHVPASAALSCVGCHIPGGHAAAMGIAQPAHPGDAGRRGAPIPGHAGIPNVHFERLTCTACHSGPWPDSQTIGYQTSFAHGLGIARKDRRADELPHIIGPVFATNDEGRIAPHRLLRPAFWAVRDGDKRTPIPIEKVRQAAARVKVVQPMSDETLRALFTEMRKAAGTAKDSARAVVYVRDGAELRLSDDGAIVESPLREGEPGGALLWPIAHSVRPAAQALGARGCGDCHEPTTALREGRIGGFLAGDETEPMRAYAPLDEASMALLAVGLPLKPVALVIGWGACSLLAAGLLARLARRG